MAPVKIYGLAMSTCTRRVMMVAEEKGIPYEIVPVDLTKGEHKQPEFLKRQPFGVIPALEDGDVEIFESRAMARYLANAYATTGIDLLGKDAKQRGITENWIEVESNYFNGPTSTIVAERYFKPVFYNTPGDEAVAKAAIEKLNSVLDVYETRLATQPYLAGQEFSLADISHMPYLQYALDAGAGEVLDKHPNVKAWWERISSRPSWKKLTAK